MKQILLFIITLFSLNINAQNTYTELTEKAIKVAQSQDSINYKTAIDIFKKAFKKYPDSINGTGYYHASILAANLKQKDLAFKYLTTLAKMETDEDGFPGWSFVLDDYAKEDYKNLLNDKRWNILKTNALTDKKEFFEKLNAFEKEFFKTSNNNFKTSNNVKKLYQNIKTYNPYLPKQKQNYSISLKINDSINSSYLVHLPKNYNPKNKYPTLIFLHGAVRFSFLEDYQIAQQVLSGWNRYYTKYASLNDVILIFPSANKKYNWMTSDDGFFMIPKIVKQLKTSINIDDNKVFISGHSNGSTGSFSYAMKQPTQFAGFYGFNTQPRLYTGGTFIENILNRSYINFSTDQDYYYPPNANDSLTKLMRFINADYKDYRYNGFPHWFPKFDESEPAYKILFSDLKERERNPFPKKITWEFDDDNYGNIDWLTDIKLDTLTPKKGWHKNLNFKINKELKYNKNDSLVVVNVDKKAFNFPRKSGKVIANYTNNEFRIETSCIESFKIMISPEMVNTKKKIKIYVNDKLYFDQKVKYNNDFMLKNFEETKDRIQIWVNEIILKV
ncbi:alpha/beta hydrolase-fold protein [Algibacter sp. L4_22]|uniref:alpha/beta hydrolase-fold protein n=1 Tax=Algibacter sp. L4_22 TaxID=2942477 RepID=UPI00201B556C|nr:alpha/beta hydrolase-fold protein [Algibacter sp. L4_22]MCL5129095.1 alpha/beta hydrolase-fold protein [Algibacter sp. L4_22]